MKERVNLDLYVWISITILEKLKLFRSLIQCVQGSDQEGIQDTISYSKEGKYMNKVL